MRQETTSQVRRERSVREAYSVLAENMTIYLSVSRLSIATAANLQRTSSCRSHSSSVAVALTKRTLSSSSSATAAVRPAEAASASAALPIPDPRDQKVLHVAVAGLPNAGKSTLLNYMVGDKVSAVSTKRHTTRENTLGVMTVGKAQVFFHDTPGFVSHQERDDYKPALSAASREAIETVNLTLLLVDASKDVAKRGLRSLTGLLEEALKSPCELFLVLNKVDVVNPKHRLLETTDEIMDRAQEIMDRMDKNSLAVAAAAADSTAQEQNVEAGSAVAGGKAGGYCRSSNDNGSSSSSSSAGNRRLFRDGGKTVDDHITVFMVSAKTGDGVGDIVDFLEHRARPGAWLFGRDETTNKDKRSRLQEIVREGLFKHLYKELPYQIQTHTSALSRKPDNSIFVLQELRVERKSQKRIVLGKLRYLQKDVEWDLRKLFGTRVNVQFSVVGGNK